MITNKNSVTRRFYGLVHRMLCEHFKNALCNPNSYDLCLGYKIITIFKSPLS